MWWKGLIICYENIIHVNYSWKITSKYLLCRTTWEYCHIYVRVAAFWQRVFLTKFACSHRCDAIKYTHDIFHNKCKRPHHATRKFEIYTLKINTIIWHCKKQSDYFWTRVYTLETFTEVMPDHLRKRHPREDEHGTPQCLPIYKETYYHKMMHKKSQIYMGDILGYTQTDMHICVYTHIYIHIHKHMWMCNLNPKTAGTLTFQIITKKCVWSVLFKKLKIQTK